MDCHLLVSDLFWPASAGNEPYNELALPALETLLARGRRLKTPGASLERALATQYGLPDALPLAPFSLRGDGGEPAQTGVCAPIPCISRSTAINWCWPTPRGLM